MYQTLLDSISQIPGIRIIKRGWRLPILIIPPEQLTIIPPLFLRLVSLFIDSQGSLHYELNSPGYARFPWGFEFWRVLFNPKRHFLKLPEKMIQTSFLKSEKNLIGGVHFTFDPKTRGIEVQNIGVLSRKDFAKRCQAPEEIGWFTQRDKAFATLHQEFDRFSHHVGARSAICSTLTIPAEKLARFGWKKIKLLSFTQKLRYGWSSFPIQGQDHYLKNFI
ncbi:MAG: hypothetical protein HYS22_00435 [Deltaproteobacteria bacterium]|nr:hypothetical protein [Deltaproteobacteria bacterium]